MSAPHLLVVGAGSVGKRHLRNFAQLGCRLSAVDPRADRLAEAGAETSLVRAFTSLHDAEQSPEDLGGVVIASPTSLHVAQGLWAVGRRLPILLEKPVSEDLASAERLRDAARGNGVSVLLGYSYRWWPPLARMRARLEAGDVGTVRHVRCVMSAHLADWHPWERYQDFFMAKAALGGGALLDESHFLDLMLAWFGSPARVWGSVEKLSTLEIDSDDNVDVNLAFAGGLRVTLHLDLIGRPHERSITAVGDRGTLRWSYEQNAVGFATTAEPTWTNTPFTCERNDMFLATAREFLDVVRGSLAPSCTLDDGVRVLRVIEAIRESSATGQTVAMHAC